MLGRYLLVERTGGKVEAEELAEHNRADVRSEYPNISSLLMMMMKEVSTVYLKQEAGLSRLPTICLTLSKVVGRKTESILGKTKIMNKQVRKLNWIAEPELSLSYN